MAEPAAPRVTRLAWESEHFGFPVGRIGDPALDKRGLGEALVAARAEGYRLIVWSTTRDVSLSDALLGKFAGAHVDAKTTFVRSLGETERHSGSAEMQERGRRQGALIEPYTGATAGDDLIRLALAAGVYSRFRVDPRCPREKFESLYRLWIERSVRHELADEVLAARMSPESPACGMITLTMSEAVGSIGLIAVDDQVRGQGVGRALVEAGLDWMRSRGAREARVVTQGANEPACRLYRRSGFAVGRVEQVYHFWVGG
jgi:dTDP-4-amino-4,6-dideoxy-D-galactose acyltransferase